ncbi:MAG: hypothetical protein ACKOSQ_06650 [Planctomycetaceae bacterium]
MARKRGRKPRRAEPACDGPDDEAIDPAALFGMLADALGLQAPIDIRAGRKPSKAQRAGAAAEELVAEAMMLDIDDLPRQRAAGQRTGDGLAAEQSRLAHEALAISRDCASAHALLGDIADSPAAAEECFRAGLAAGERALGADVIERYAGELGRIPEARGWLMCRRGLVQCLGTMGRHDEAIAECEMLARLDAADTIAARFMHLDLLVTQGHFAAARRICADTRDEPFSGWSYARALVEFAAEGDTPAARRLLATAVEANPHVPRLMLSGDEVEPADVLVEVGGRDEAAMYVRDSRATWLDVPGSPAWLRSATDTARDRPDRARRAPGPDDGHLVRLVLMAIDVRSPDGRLVHVVVIGQSGVQQGLAIYEDRAALDAALSGDETAAESVTSLAVMFGEAFEIHAIDHDRIESRGFEVAGPEAWPLVIRVEPGMVTRPPLVWETELVTACLRDVPAFVAAVPPPRRGWFFGRGASPSASWTAPSGQRLSWT